MSLVSVARVGPYSRLSIGSAARIGPYNSFPIVLAARQRPRGSFSIVSAARIGTYSSLYKFQQLDRDLMASYL